MAGARGPPNLIRRFLFATSAPQEVRPAEWGAMSGVLQPGPNAAMSVFMTKKTSRPPAEPRKVYNEADNNIHYPKDVKGQVLL